MKPNFTAADVKLLATKLGGVRNLEREVNKLYVLARGKRGLSASTINAIRLNAKDINMASDYLFHRAMGGGEWTGNPDLAMRKVLESLNRQKNGLTKLISAPTAASPQKNVQPVINKSGLTRVDLLMMGTVDPRKEKRGDLEKFLLEIAANNETGSNAIKQVITADVDLNRLLRLVNRFLEPPLSTLNKRVEKILSRDPNLEGKVAQALARAIRGSQEIGQQLIRANSQLSTALRACLKEMNLPKEEHSRVLACLTKLDATRVLAVREMNVALRLAQKEIDENGSLADLERSMEKLMRKT
jgi:hypothetical protein